MNQSINYLSTEKNKYELKNQYSKAFIDYSEVIDDVYENVEDYNPTKKRKMLVVFDMECKKNVRRYGM